MINLLETDTVKGDGGPKMGSKGSTEKGLGVENNYGSRNEVFGWRMNGLGHHLFNK